MGAFFQLTKDMVMDQITAETILTLPQGKYVMLYPNQQGAVCPELFVADLIVMGDIVIIVDANSAEAFNVLQAEWMRTTKERFLAGGGMLTEDSTYPEVRDHMKYFMDSSGCIIFTRKEVSEHLANRTWQIRIINEVSK